MDRKSVSTGMFSIASGASSAGASSAAEEARKRTNERAAADGCAGA